MAKRQSGRLHRMQIRIKEADYDNIKLICDRMGITMAEYFNNLIQHDGYEDLLRIARTIKSEPRAVDISFYDEKTGERVDKLCTSVNALSEQTKRIGRNVSAMIRDIRNGRVAASQTIPYLEKIGTAIQKQEQYCNALNKEMKRLIYSDEGIQKTEIRYKDGGGY